MRLRLKSKNGTKIVNIEDDKLPLVDLLKLIRETFEINQANVITGLKNGFPPKTISLDEQTLSITECGIKNGDQLIVEFQDSQVGGEFLSNKESTSTSTVQQSDIPSVFISDLKKYLILRNIPDDNSCMFNSISYAVNGSGSYLEGGISPSKSLRSVVKSYIESNPDKYNEAVLERSPEDYCSWITKKDSWGGAIELGILADWFNLRINCIDVGLGNFISFEPESTPPKKFIVLVYSGIHYDVLGLNTVLSKNSSDFLKDETIWDIDSDIGQLINEKALELCKLLQTKNYTTNTTTFRVRCLECYEVLVGETSASKHANDTGHYRFGEVN